MKRDKKFKIWLFIITFIAISQFIFFNNPVIAEEQYTIVQGNASIEGNKDIAKKKALSDAFRNAVERGLGVWIKSQSEVKDFELKKDEILTRAEGYVTSYEILNEQEHDGLYTVTIKAKVSVDKIGEDVKKMVGILKTQMGNPSISFVLTTWVNKGNKETLQNVVDYKNLQE